MDWYDTLNKPFLNPPSDIFTPVWTILYIMMALSLIFYLKGGNIKEKKTGLFLFIIQLLLNFAWSGVFFGMQNIFLALIVIILMWLFILFTVIAFFKHSKLAAIMLIPYLVWVSFAFYLNLSFWILN